MRNKFLAIGVCILSLFVTGCIKDSGSNRSHAANDDYFDFKINQSTALSVDYRFPNQDYAVLFEVYDRNPMSENEDGELIKQDIEPIYRATTDGSGKLTADDIQIPSCLTKVWIYSEYPGTLSPVEVQVKDNRIEFDLDSYVAQLRKKSTRAVTGSGHTYPDGWLTLGDWDEYGTPDYLEPERTMPTASTLYNINEVYMKNTMVKLKERYPQFFAQGLSSELHIIKPTKVYLVFINSTAAWKNTVGYYTYPTGQDPQKVADIKRIVAFPSVTPFIKKSGETMVRGALVGGDRVQLKYWDGKEFQEEFPAGVSIGWWLEGMGFNISDGNITIQGNGLFSRFSSDILNKDGARRTVALRDPDSDRIVAIGFEDNIDLRYNDATFYLEVEEDGAIDGNIPTLPDDNGGPSDAQNYVKTDGFLMFEDLWPYTGDYDMNDVMIKYSSKVYKHILNNSVYKVETEYIPYHNGGKIQSGFGIQFTGLSAAAVRKVTIEGAAPSHYMEGQKLEPGQTSPTIILYDNAGAVTDRTVVTVELNDAPESQVVPPFNPFIFTESDKMRGKEVHLVKNLPTDKADVSFFGTGKDGSNPKAKLYYVMPKNEKQYPFALNMPFLQEIPIPDEGTNIDISYPKFRNWVESDGKSNKDWYLYPAKK